MEGAALGGAVEVPTAGARTVPSVSMVKFLRLLETANCRRSKTDKDSSSKLKQVLVYEDHWMGGSELMVNL